MNNFFKNIFAGTLILLGMFSSMTLVESAVIGGTGNTKFSSNGTLFQSSTSINITGSGVSTNTTGYVITGGGGGSSSSTTINQLSNSSNLFNFVGAGGFTIATSSTSTVTFTQAASTITIGGVTSSTFNAGYAINVSATGTISLLPSNLILTNTTLNATTTFGSTTNALGLLNASGNLTAFTSSTTSGGSNCLTGVTISATGTLTNTNSACSGGGGSITTSSAPTKYNFPFWANATGGLSGTSTLFFASSTGYIGIGTTAPTSPLTVLPPAGSASTIEYIDQSAACCSATGININTQAGYGGRFINMQINGVDELYVGMFNEAGSGSYAPGLIAPTADIPVDFGNANGSLRVLPYNDGYTYFEATQSNFRFTGLFGAAGTNEMFEFNHNSFGSLTAALSTADVFGNMAVGSYAGTNAAPSNGLIVSGNVGIGTSAPSTTLHVAGTFQLAASSSVVTPVISGAIIGTGCDSATSSIDSSYTSSTTAFVTTPRNDPGTSISNFYSLITSPGIITTRVCGVGVSPNATDYVVKIIR